VTIAAVIFDFGGVIVPGSPADGANSPFTPIEEAHGLPQGFIWRAIYLDNPAWLRLRVGEGTEAGWLALAEERLEATAGRAATERAMAAFAETRPQGGALAGQRPAFNAGMIDLLGRLRPRYRVGLLSNAAPGLEAELRDHYAIDHLFDDIVNSATVRLAKPDPRIFRVAAERIGVAIEQCFFTDDLAHNVEAASAAGMTAHVFDGAAGLLEALRAAGVDA
jgi:putative hydrolase of the HAD superfamily